MTEQEIETLISLLHKLKKNNLHSLNVPLPLWYALCSVVTQAAVEVIITTNYKNFLLTERHDKHWDGWHIPGGFIGYRESIEEACIRVAQREVGITVHLEKVITAYSWKDHPYASAVSIVCICTSDQKPTDGKFFTIIPKNIINHHDEFIQEFLEYVKKNNK